jgi:hypothetical protein
MPQGPTRWLEWLPCLVLALIATAMEVVLGGRGLAPQISSAAPPEAPPRLDPAAWGSDHVGQSVPQYMESGECLFCHRDQVGGSWQTNKHNRTIRDADAGEPAVAALHAEPATKAIAGEVQLLLGDTRAQRFLRRSADYGKVDLLSTGAILRSGRRPRLTETRNPHWDSTTFATQCAGCHATAVDPTTHAFATVALDCFSCHGDAPAGHTDDAKLIMLARQRKDSAQVVISICASCHIRFGKSASSGLPYPSNFVAGDNLFKDFQVDFDKADDERLNGGDRHVMQNVRDVVLFGRESVTCLTCHAVHSGSTKAHRELPIERSCLVCHDDSKPIQGHKTYEVHSDRCRY